MTKSIKRTLLFYPAAFLAVSTAGVLAQDPEDNGNTSDGGATASETATSKISPRKDSSSIGILPKDRSGVQLAQGERNPFHQLSDVTITLKKDDRGTEENTIRTILAGLRASGVHEGSKGISVTLGDLHLRTGMEVPHVIPNQTKRLIVTGVTRTFVEFAWLDKRRNALGQKFVVTVDVDRPPVPFVLPGQGKGAPDKKALPNGAVKWGVSPRKTPAPSPKNGPISSR